MIKQFKVPWTRYKTPENTMEKNDAISYEEYAFSRMIMRFQRRFADGFKKSFITHLKLIGLWKTYQLKESDFSIDFVNDTYSLRGIVPVITIRVNVLGDESAESIRLYLNLCLYILCIDTLLISFIVSSLLIDMIIKNIKYFIKMEVKMKN